MPDILTPHAAFPDCAPYRVGGGSDGCWGWSTPAAPPPAANCAVQEHRGPRGARLGELLVSLTERGPLLSSAAAIDLNRWRSEYREFS